MPSFRGKVFVIGVSVMTKNLPACSLITLGFTYALVLAMPALLHAEAESPSPSTERSFDLEVVKVEGKGEEEIKRYLPDTKDSKILSAKKTSFTNLEELPSITTNNYRQALIKTPGLNTSEVTNEGFLSINYRGLGDPHESFNVQLLRDGLPIAADPFGYPAGYYAPPLEAIESLEFISGGSGLIYGTQPGGSLNFISREPTLSTPLAGRSKHVFGSKGLYSTYNELSGSSDNFGYLGYFHHRQSDGFRDFNSDYSVDTGHLRAVVVQSPDTTFRISADAYVSDHGEAGGLAVTSLDGQANFYEDRWQSTRGYDRLRIERYSPTFSVEHSFNKDTNLTSTFWANFLDRYSKRQDLGSAPSFGGVANGTTNTIARQQFVTFGNVTRVAHSYELGDVENTLSAGVQLMNIHSPLTEKKGDRPDSEGGRTQKDIERNTFAGSVFAENLIKFGKLRVTPGIRVENIVQSIDEETNVSVADEALRDINEYTAVPLLGIGAAYEVAPSTDLYANISEGYRPTQYQDTLPLGPGDIVNSDLDESRTLTYEAGLRGTPEKWFSWDTSLFTTEYDDQVGRVGTQIQNVGRARYRGWDAATEVRISSLADDAFDTELRKLGELSLTANLSLLDAEFTAGPLNGFSPQYAPSYLSRFGVTYDYEAVKLGFLGTFVGKQFGDDANNVERTIPSYRVWDLLADVDVYGDTVAVTFGINNVFDEKYFSRVRSNGIDPALPRNYYGGLIVRF